MASDKLSAAPLPVRQNGIGIGEALIFATIKFDGADFVVTGGTCTVDSVKYPFS